MNFFTVITNKFQFSYSNFSTHNSFENGFTREVRDHLQKAISKSLLFVKSEVIRHYVLVHPSA